MSNYTIYTDGACSGNPGPGGWAMIIIDEQDNLIHSLANCEADTTNNRMELTGFLEALIWCGLMLDDQDTVTIYVDSAYVYNCFHDKWYESWIKHGWKNAAKQPVANQDLWQRILKEHEILKDQLIIEKVAGHSGNKWNNLADYLAVDARKNLK